MNTDKIKAYIVIGVIAVAILALIAFSIQQQRQCIQILQAGKDIPIKCWLLLDNVNIAMMTQ